MIISQVNPLEFQAIRTLDPVFVRDSVATPTQSNHRGFVVDSHSSGTGHYEYEVEGFNIANLQLVWSSMENSVDLSAIPLIKRVPGINAIVCARFTNGRGISLNKRLDFCNVTEAPYITGPAGVVAGNYTEYSLGRTKAIFDELTGPSMFDGSGNRAHTEVIPHASFTCHAYGGPRPPMTGLRFTAVTSRHLVGVAHYGYGVGDVVQFRTVANVPVYRTIQAIWNPRTYTSGEVAFDFQIFLLNEALPGTILPAPVVGDWFSQIQSGTEAVNYCPQHVGLTVWNNDGHITPSGNMNVCDIANSGTSRTVDTIETNTVSTALLGEPGSVKIPGEERLDRSNPTAPFYHNRRAGDSGSPPFAPVEGGWALCGLVSGGLWSAVKINEAIARLDFHAGISSGLTVTVAADPTL
jgi:hypothetical protein